VEKIKVPVLLQAGEDDSMEGFSTPKETKAVADKIKVCIDTLPCDVLCRKSDPGRNLRLPLMVLAFTAKSKCGDGNPSCTWGRRPAAMWNFTCIPKSAMRT
jgi:hypothetical protein